MAEAAQNTQAVDVTALERVLRHIHNRFECATLGGTFEVSSGALPIAEAQSGQYAWIEGSVFNDVLHRCPMTGLDDEVFEGRVVLLAVPKAVESLAEEIGAWCEANAKALASPFQSESFGGYSYSKGGSEGGSGGWEGHFSSELNQWRKVSHSGW